MYFFWCYQHENLRETETKSAQEHRLNVHSQEEQSVSQEEKSEMKKALKFFISTEKLSNFSSRKTSAVILFTHTSAKSEHSQNPERKTSRQSERKHIFGQTATACHYGN